MWMNGAAVSVSAPLYHIMAHGCRSVSVVVIVATEYVGKEKQLEDEEKYEKLHQYQSPEVAPDRHLAEPFEIEAEYPQWEWTFWFHGGAVWS